jgi:anti-sigma B factor antagonist
VAGCHVSSETRGSACIVSVLGDVDLSGAADVEEAISAGDGAPVVVADLTGVTFIDSTGLRALVSARDALAGARRALLLVVEGGPVRRLLSLTSLEREFRVHPSVEAALSSD